MNTLPDANAFFYTGQWRELQGAKESMRLSLARAGGWETVIANRPTVIRQVMDLMEL